MISTFLDFLFLHLLISTTTFLYFWILLLYISTTPDFHLDFPITLSFVICPLLGEDHENSTIEFPKVYSFQNCSHWFSAQFPTMMIMIEIFTFCWYCIKNLILIENLPPCANLRLLLQHLPNPFSVSYVDLIISECTITCIFHQSSAESDPSNLTSSNLYATRYLLLNLKFKFQKNISTWQSDYVLVYDVISIQWVYRLCIHVKTEKSTLLVFSMEIFLM